MSIFTHKQKAAMNITLATAAAAAALFTTGCANMVTTATTAPVTAAASIGGHIHGGNQPISGASVRLYAAGTTGYGAGATLYATTTSATDGFGSFAFTKAPTNTGPTTPGTAIYGCPLTGDPQMYITAIGGSTQGTGNGTNSAAAFIVAIGKCSTIGSGTFVDLNEVTSVGTLASLQQYFNPASDSFGYPNTTQAATGFANGVSTIANLVNVSTGTVNSGSTLTATPTGSTIAASVTVLPEFAKINTIADIAAACVNTTSSTSTACGTLFANAIPPVAANTSQPSGTFATATDVLQATYYMLTNPADESTPGTNNPTAVNNLFGLAPAAAPFQPTIATAPTDWTIGIRYSSTSACTYGTFLTASYQLAADAVGNIWIASGGTSTTTSNLIEVTPNGTPATCTLGTSVALAKGLTIDTSGNIWIAGNAANSPFYKYIPSTPASVAFAVPTAGVPNVVAADGLGNIFYTDSINKQLNEFVGGATASAAVAATNVATVGNSPLFLAIDTAGNIVVTQSATTNILYLVQPSSATGNTNGYATTTIGSATNVVNPYAVAAGLGGSFYLGNSTSASSAVSQSEYSLLPGAAGAATFSANSAQYAGGIGAPRGPNAIDGAGNVWFGNSLATTGNYVTGSASALFDISEFTAAGVALSPQSQTGGFQKDATIINSAPRGLTIDPTGNVWFGSNSAGGNGIVEIVGAAVPVVTPISAALKAGISSGNAVQKP